MIEYSFSIAELEYFLIILARVAGFIFVVPFFSMGNTPRRFRTALSIFLAYLIYQTTLPHEVLAYSTVLEYAIIVMKETVTGIMIGFSANICNSIVLFAGRMVDMEIGLSMANAMDPTTKEQATLTGFYYQYMVILILIVSDLYQYIVTAISESFILIPVNGTVFHMDKMLTNFIQFMGDYINIGFRICLPIFCSILIVNVVLGILAKVAPQMNMFAIGIQIKMLVGLGVMFLTVRMLPYAADFIYTEMKTMMVSFVEAMMA
jgi:flagellar biosynthetic protein FliR